MLTKMVEFTLHMTNFLGMGYIWHDAGGADLLLYMTNHQELGRADVRSKFWITILYSSLVRSTTGLTCLQGICYMYTFWILIEW